jgi:hypothetical protein
MRSRTAAAKMGDVSELESVDLMPVVGLRLLEGRVGSTLLMELLASAPEVVSDRRYPIGEYRYLSYCARLATWMGTPFDPDRDLGVTEMLFGPQDRGGPLPWPAASLSVEALGPRVLRALWGACSVGFRERSPQACWYAEKLAYSIDPVIDAGIPLRLIDVVRDPRDVVASMIAFGERSGPWGFGRTPGQSEEDWITALITTFAKRIDTILAPTAVPTLRLRYEDFAVDLHGTAETLGALFGLTLDPDMLTARSDDHVTSPSVEASIGRWHRDLAKDVAERISTSLGPRLEALGYSSL